MFTKKQVQNFRNRINRAKVSFSIGTDLCLTLEIDTMTRDQRIFLRDALLNSRKPLSYDYLDKRINSQNGIFQK